MSIYKNNGRSPYFFYLLLLLTSCNGTSARNQEGIGEVMRGDLVQRVTIAGNVIPKRKTLIAAPYNGYIKKLFVKLGDHVEQNDPLVTVVPSLQSTETTYPLRSPLVGTVVQMEKSEGEFVNEGDVKDFILRIDDTSTLYILAYTPEIDRLKVQAGQETLIKASAIINHQYKGIIRELALAAVEKEQWGRSQAAEFPIKIEIMDKDENLHPGMSVIIDVITARKKNVLTLRHEFIHREADSYFVVKANGQRQNIKLGIQNEEMFEVLEGVQEGDKVQQVDYAELKLSE